MHNGRYLAHVVGQSVRGHDNAQSFLQFSRDVASVCTESLVMVIFVKRVTAHYVNACLFALEKSCGAA